MLQESPNSKENKYPIMQQKMRKKYSKSLQNVDSKKVTFVNANEIESGRSINYKAKLENSTIFLTMVVHDLRHPIESIKENIRVLIEGTKEVTKTYGKYFKENSLYDCPTDVIENIESLKRLHRKQVARNPKPSQPVVSSQSNSKKD